MHRRHGSDGIKVLAALLARLDAGTPGAPMTLALVDIAREALGETRGARTLRARMAKVRAVLERVSEVECTRVTEHKGRCTARTGRLLTVLDQAQRMDPARLVQSGPVPNAVPGAEAPAAGSVPGLSGALEPRWTVLLDPVFQRPGGGTLGTAFRDIPRAVFSPEAKRHPYLLALFVYLRRAWGREHGKPGGTAEGPDSGLVQLPARQLFQECGLWLKESSPYRSVELLKRELAHMKEAGWLGRWRVIPAPAKAGRDPLEDQYRLEAPGWPAARPEPYPAPAGEVAV